MVIPWERCCYIWTASTHTLCGLIGDDEPSIISRHTNNVDVGHICRRALFFIDRLANDQWWCSMCVNCVFSWVMCVQGRVQHIVE